MYFCNHESILGLRITCLIYRVAQKSKPLPNYQKMVLNPIKLCHWDWIFSSN